MNYTPPPPHTPASIKWNNFILIVLMFFRSDIPLVNRVSMLTLPRNNTLGAAAVPSKKEDLTDNIMSDINDSEELDDSEEADSESSDSDAEQNLDFYNEGVSSLEGDEESDENDDDELADSEVCSVGFGSATIDFLFLNPFLLTQRTFYSLMFCKSVITNSCMSFFAS